MKRILACVLITLFLSLNPAFGGEIDPVVDQGYEADEEMPDSEISISKEEGVTVFMISGDTADRWNETVVPYLMKYYFEKGEFKEVTISCFLKMETVFPSEDYTIASSRTLQLYDAFIERGIPSEDLFISVRFEKKVPDTGVFTVEFFDDSNYFQRVGANFVGGIADIILSPVELPKEMVDESRENGAAIGVTKGTFSGFGKALRKAGNGTIKLLTFWAG